jgi:hypothetical protein
MKIVHVVLILDPNMETVSVAKKMNGKNMPFFDRARVPEARSSNESAA